MIEALKEGGRARLTGVSVYPALAEKREAAPDSITALVILLEWSDYPSTSDGTPFSFESFVNNRMRAYFDEVSLGRFRITGESTVWLTSEKAFHYYVNSDGTAGTADDFGFDTSESAFTFDPPMNVWGLAREAIRRADDAGVDFTQYDNDGPDGFPGSGDDDGIVDAVIIIHAGPGAESLNPAVAADNIWSHKSDFTDPTLVNLMGETIADGVKIGPYILITEVGALGVYVHEFGHILGLPDVYTTYVDQGVTVQRSVVGAFCLMDAGGLVPLRGSRAGDVPTHINPVFKEWLGWLDPVVYEDRPGGNTSIPDVRLGPVAVTGDAVRLLANPGGPDWDDPEGGDGEYFLLEYRTPQAGSEESVPAAGLLIWHADETYPDNARSSPSQQLVQLVLSDPERSGIGVTDLGSENDVWPNGTKDEWTPESNPSSALHSGAYSGVSVRRIALPAGDNEVVFDVDLFDEREETLMIYPNPFRPAGGAKASISFRPGGETSGPSASSNIFQVRIFDIGGTPVRLLSPGGSAGDDWIVTWDGTNDTGEPVAAGVYLVVVHAGKETRTGKIAVLQ